MGLGRHGYDGAVDILFAVAEHHFVFYQVGHGILHFASALQFLQLDAVGREPLAVRMGSGKALLDFSVIIDFAFLGVNQQNLAGLQTPLLGNLCGVEVHDTNLTGHYHHVVLGDGVTGGAQTVAVEHTAGIAAVAEEQGCRTVPRLHQDGVVFVESLEVFGDGVLVVETFGHEHRHGVGQTHAAHDHELQHVVQRSGVAHARLHDGAERSNVSERFGGEHRLASLHPGAVAADGVDFAVVSQETERLSQSPGRERVGGEAGVNHCQSAGEVGLRQVREVFSQLHRREHTFIYNGTRGQGAAIEILVADLAFRFLSDDIEFALQGVALRSGDEELFDVRFALSCLSAEDVRIDGHGSEVHQRESLSFCLFHDDAQNRLLPFGVFGQEDESGTIASLFGNGDSLQEDEFVGNLKHDARSVTGFLVGTFRSAVLHVFQHLERVVHQFVAFASVNVDNHAYTAGIVFVVGAIESPARSIFYGHKACVS